VRYGMTCRHRNRRDRLHLLGEFHGLNGLGVVVTLELECVRMLPEVSTMVVVRWTFSSGGMVITGTIFCMLGMNVSFTSAVMRLEG
jgi:hypothetical protein